MKENLCIVLARGGSKRIPRKNARVFCGRPMAAWPVVHAMKSGLFSDIVISTDDPEIADAATAVGATMDRFRPAALCDDNASTAAALKHELLSFREREGGLPKACCCLYGTSALAFPELLRQGLDTLRARRAEFLMALIPYAHPIERALQWEDSGLVRYRQPEFALTRTQDIKPSYHDAGLLYWVCPEAFFRCGGQSFVPLRKTAIVVSSCQAADIDTENDWALAERIARANGLAERYADSG